MSDRNPNPVEQPSPPQNGMIPSIQLIHEHPQPSNPDICPVRKDRKSSHALSVNNFIQKTYAILQEKQYQSIVSWSDSAQNSMGWKEGNVSNGSSGGNNSISSFKIHNLRAFEEIVLPKYFKHSNMSSFVRQVHFVIMLAQHVQLPQSQE